jgi:hypothetical protein
MMEIFFSCEQNGSKDLISTAQMCVWGLSSVSGRFPTESGRFKRVLEVVTLSNHGNVFQSERIQCESCRVLKSLVINNLDLVQSHCVDWVVPVVKSLCHRGEKIRGLALEALLAGVSVLWRNLPEIEQRLNSDESIWELVNEFIFQSVQEPPLSLKRLHLSRCLGCKSYNVRCFIII